MQTPDTLDILRRRYKAFKERAASQCPVTPQMISKASRTHVSKIHSLMLRNMICGAAALLLWPFLCHKLGLSIAFEITTIVMLCYFLASKWWSLRNISDPSDSDVSLLKLAQHSLQARKRLLTELYIGSVAAALWFIFFCFEIARILPADEAAFMTAICTISACIGYIIGYRMYRRMREELKTLHDNITDILATETGVSAEA